MGKGGNDMTNLMRNPNQLLGKLQSVIDPKIMASLGGAGNLMNMMKEMTSNPQMSEMMKQFGGGDLGALAGGKKKRK